MYYIIYKCYNLFYFQSYTKAVDFEIVNCCVSSELNIIGFLENSKVECPATLSRHLILPQQVSDDCTENNEASLKIPSFCVLLHGSLKVKHFSIKFIISV